MHHQTVRGAVFACAISVLALAATPANADGMGAALPLGFTSGGTGAGSAGSAGAGGDYSYLIARHARSAGVPVHIAMAVVRVESNYNPRARGRGGEIGLMQIKPATARGIGYTGSMSALYDPDTNLRWGMAYLGEAYKLAGGDVCGTILRYNAGHYATRMNPISSRYCGKVRSMISTGDFGGGTAKAQLANANALSGGDGARQFHRRYDPTAL